MPMNVSKSESLSMLGLRGVLFGEKKLKILVTSEVGELAEATRTNAFVEALTRHPNPHVKDT